MEEDGTKFFIVAQSIVNLVEGLLMQPTVTDPPVSFLQIAVFLHFAKNPRCEIIAFSASLCVAAKTVLYGTIEAVSGGRHTSQNSWVDFIFLYIIPNNLWVVMPLLTVYTLGSRMAERMYNANAKAKSS